MSACRPRRAQRRRTRRCVRPRLSRTSSDSRAPRTTRSCQVASTGMAEVRPACWSFSSWSTPMNAGPVVVADGADDLEPTRRVEVVRPYGWDRVRRLGPGVEGSDRRRCPGPRRSAVPGGRWAGRARRDGTRTPRPAAQRRPVVDGRADVEYPEVCDDLEVWRMDSTPADHSTLSAAPVRSGGARRGVGHTSPWGAFGFVEQGRLVVWWRERE